MKQRDPSRLSFNTLCVHGSGSFHGPAFYGLPRNQGTVTLKRQPWTLPETVPFGEAELKPLRGGEIHRQQT